MAVKPSKYDGADYVVGWIASAKGVRGISQTSTGATKSGVVANINSAGQTVLNGDVVTTPSLPTTTIAGQVLSVQVAGATTVPPVTQGRCLKLKIAHAKAYRALSDARKEAASSGNPIDPDPLFDRNDAADALNACLDANLST